MTVFALTELGNFFGDAGLFFGFGMWLKGAQASQVMRYGLLVSAGGEAAIASYRTYQGVQALQNEDNLTAAARFGEAALRLIGVGVNTAAYLKAVGRAKTVTQLATAPTVRQTLGRPANSTILGENLEIVSGVTRPANSAAHHIVAGNAARAAPARAILANEGIDINEAANGVFLPRDTTVAAPPA